EVPSVDALSTTSTSSTIGGICSIVARTPSSSLWHGMTTEMRLPRNMGTPRRERCDRRRAQAFAVVVAALPRPAPPASHVPRARCCLVSLRHALRILRLDLSFSTAGIMRGLKRMLMVRKHSYVQKHFDSRMNRRDASAASLNQICLKSYPASRTLPSLRSIRSSHG